MKNLFRYPFYLEHFILGESESVKMKDLTVRDKKTLRRTKKLESGSESRRVVNFRFCLLCRCFITLRLFSSRGLAVFCAPIQLFIKIYTDLDQLGLDFFSKVCNTVHS